MRNVLIRGLPDKIHNRIQKLADKRNASVNQVLVQLVIRSLKDVQEREDKEAERDKIFKRIHELREAHYRKYGKSEDSAKMVREMREERTRHLEDLI